MSESTEFEIGKFQGAVLESLKAIESRLEKIEGRLDGYSKRIRRLEFFQAGLLGGGTVIGWLLKAWVG